MALWALGPRVTKEAKCQWIHLVSEKAGALALFRRWWDPLSIFPSSSAPGHGVLCASHQGVLILDSCPGVSWNLGLEGVSGTPVHFILSPLCENRPWQTVSTEGLLRHLGSVMVPQQDSGPRFCIWLPLGCPDIVCHMAA